MELHFIYVWVLMKNIGFFMEPDVRLVKVFMTKKEVLYYISKNPLFRGHYFYERKRVYL